jgi:hypothetical protein
VDCGTQLHAGSPSQSLKTWEDRNQPNPKDRWFLVESRPELVMRRGQSKFKTKDHGALAGLPYSVKKMVQRSKLFEILNKSFLHHPFPLAEWNIRLLLLQIDDKLNL